MLEGQLHEEQGGAVGGVGGTIGVEGEGTIGVYECAFFEERPEVGEFGAGDEITVENFQDGEEASTEVEAAVVAAAGEHGRKEGGKVVPTGIIGEFPEDGVEKRTRVGGRAAFCLMMRREVGLEEAELGGGEVVEFGFGGRRVEEGGLSFEGFECRGIEDVEFCIEDGRSGETGVRSNRWKWARYHFVVLYIVPQQERGRDSRRHHG